MTRFTIKIGESSALQRGAVHLILRDQNGHRAVRECRNGPEVDDLLIGWANMYRCDTDELLLQALDHASPAVTQLFNEWARSMTTRSSPHIISPEGVRRMMQLAERPYRPREILDLKRWIGAETRATVLAAGITGAVDYGRILDIVGHRLELDRLYGDWAEGRID